MGILFEEYGWRQHHCCLDRGGYRLAEGTLGLPRGRFTCLHVSEWPGPDMKCPHCLVSFHDAWGYWMNQDGQDYYTDCKWSFRFKSTVCPACKQLICKLVRDGDGRRQESSTVYPKGSTRPVPVEVEKEFANDFREACLVIGDSEKASAALSRRCLQNLLREKAKTKKRDLAEQIQEVLDSGKLPSHLATTIDTVRAVGNFAAHPIKSQHTGEVICVEPGEAEWLLETLEDLFDFYCVQPAKSEKKRDELNEKLKEAGKPAVEGGCS